MSTTAPLQTLTLDEVKTKAREYYAAGKLMAQHPDPSKRVCVNKGPDGYRCAVAAAFNEALITAYPEGRFKSAVNRGLVNTDNVEAIKNIQEAHDDWARDFAESLGVEAYAEELKAKFLSLIAA